MRTATLAVLTLLAWPSDAPAQVERYEVGRRMKAFEAAWETTTDAARKKRALAIVADATTQFLTFRLGDAARTLDEARFALQSDDPSSDEVRWLLSLCAVPEKRLVDSAAKELRVEVRQFYPVKGGPPDGAKVTLCIGTPVLGKPVKVPLGKLPANVAVPYPQLGWRGDQYLWMEATIDGKRIRTSLVGVSAFRDLADSLKSQDAVDSLLRIDDLSKHRAGIELATLRSRAKLVRDLAGGDYPETDVRIRKLAEEAGWIGLNGLFGGLYFANRPGDHSLTVPTAKDKSTPCRVFVPKGLDPKKPVPIVVALHGMGGSENLFFEGYGAGCVVKACEKRGWICVSPRGGLGFLSGPPPVTDILAKLGERYPIDTKRVFVLGHSMGAAQSIELAQEHPGKFAAVAALGGGGKVRKPEAFAGLPVFVGVGEKDFANRGAKATRDAIAKVPGEKLTFKEYPDVEHMVIVRAAVDDVFAVFDQAAK